MSLRWSNNTYSEQPSFALVDSMGEQIAEVFEVAENEWHFNIADNIYGVSSTYEDAQRMIYNHIGIRPTG